MKSRVHVRSEKKKNFFEAYFPVDGCNLSICLIIVNYVAINQKGLTPVKQLR